MLLICGALLYLLLLPQRAFYHFRSLFLLFPFQVPPQDTSVNRQGIPGWDKVDRLAVELLSLKGISVMKKQAERVIHLYDELDEYDKRPLTYKSVIWKPSAGRFARSKHRSGHVGTEAVAR